MNGGGYYIFDEMTSLIAEAIDTQSKAPSDWSLVRDKLSQPLAFSGPLGLVASHRHAEYVDMDTFLAACRALRRDFGWRDPRSSLEAMGHVGADLKVAAE